VLPVRPELLHHIARSFWKPACFSSKTVNPTFSLLT